MMIYGWVQDVFFTTVVSPEADEFGPAQLVPVDALTSYQ